MKRLFEIITAFLCINSVTPVLMYYIYDDNPTVGFIGVDNTVGNFVSGYNVPKKQFTGSYSPRYQKYTNEHVVDSHFKVMKTPSRYALSTLMDRNSVQRGPDYRMTQLPKVWQQNVAHPVRNPVVNIQQPQILKDQPNLPKAAKTIHGKAVSIVPTKDTFILEQRRPEQSQPQQKQKQKEINKKVTNIPPIRPKAVNADYSSPLKPLPRPQDEIFEPKANFVQMNVRKTQISQDSQKVVRRNHNRHPAASSGHEIQHNRHQRVPSSMLMDKTLHKTNGLSDHNVQLMARVLDDMTHQVSDRRQEKGEYRKRDIKTAMHLNDKSKRNPIFDNMRKYIGKEKVSVKERNDRKVNNMEVARIGSHEESLEVNNAPYALFYRMNPESLDQQEAFILMSSMEKNGNNNSNKAITNTQQFDEFEMKKTTPRKPKTNTNSMRLHKKMKNYSSFRN